MSRVSFLAFSCPHCPLQDKEAVDWLVEQIKLRQPDYIIHLGDGHEADGASRFQDDGQSIELREEFEVHNLFLRQIRLAAEIRRDGQDAAKLIFMPGNHDENIQEPGRINPRLRSLCDYNLNEPELKNWRQPAKYEYDRRTGVFRLGQVTFGHGWEAGQSADEFQSILLGSPYGLWVGGHTHKPLPVTRARKTQAVPLPYWYANAGCLRDMKPRYMKRKRTHQWGQAIVTGQADILKSPRMSRCWEAETVIFRMAQEE